MKHKLPENYEIVEAVTFNGEPKQWLALHNGFQIGGNLDSSGAGNLTFESESEAFNFILTTSK